MADVHTEVGIQIRLRRKERGLTLESLAELSGLSPSYLGQIERDAKKASLLTLAAIAAALEVPVGSLFAPALKLPSPQPLGKKIELALRESTNESARSCSPPSSTWPPSSRSSVSLCKGYSR